MNARKWTRFLAVALVLAATQGLAQAGSIFTTDSTGAVVNLNTFAAREDVYLNGGPQNDQAAGIADGTYYFQVTDPSGATLLSTDDAVNRQLVVVGGVVAGSLGAVPFPHANGSFNPVNGSTPVQLFPFDFTPNANGDYKAWLIAQTQTTWIDLDDPRVLHFEQNDALTDNFKVVPPNAPEPTTAVLLGLGLAGIGFRYRRRLA